MSAGSAGCTGPGGGSVETWVQCDGCKAWIHTRCDPRLAKGLQDPQQLKTMKYRYIMFPLLLQLLPSLLLSLLRAPRQHNEWLWEADSGCLVPELFF